MEQKITSAKTALSQVPALHKRLLGVLTSEPGIPVLDFGAGKGFGASFLLDHGVNAIAYDPYNLPGSEVLLGLQYEVVLCANVLNVLESEELVKAVVRQVISCLTSSGLAYFSVYEGDKSGEGHETPKGYQRNQKTLWYKRLMECMGLTVVRKGDILMTSRPW